MPSVGCGAFTGRRHGVKLPTLGFQGFLLPKLFVGNRCRSIEKYPTKTMALSTPPNHPKSTGAENIGPERADFGSVGKGEVGSLAATTLENN